ncbi:MAG: alpha-glucosidase C-terminal domain-containing protein, partial [Desulfomicrobium sp.]|nr:alpha-glucosidase C-terminal domain-containing protein [Desulfomicrobium sp.]
NPATQHDSRWVHRSRFDWDKAQKRHQSGTVEQRIFSALKKLIALRKELPAFADFDNRNLLQVENPNLLVFYRTDPENCRSRVLVISNFNAEAQTLPVDTLTPHGFFNHGGMTNLCSGERVPVVEEQISIPALSFYWLRD